MKNVNIKDLPEDLKKDLALIENGSVDENLKNIKKIDGNIMVEETGRNFKELDFNEVKEDEETELVLILKKPLGEITEINLDPDRINGIMLNNIEKIWRSKNKTNREQIKELDGDYLALVAAIMSGINYSTIVQLGGYDFTQLTSKVRNFLLVG